MLRKTLPFESLVELHLWCHGFHCSLPAAAGASWYEGIGNIAESPSKARVPFSGGVIDKDSLRLSQQSLEFDAMNFSLGRGADGADRPLWIGVQGLRETFETLLGCLESKPLAMTCNEVTCPGKQWYPCASWIGSFVLYNTLSYLLHPLPDINAMYHECTFHVPRKLGGAQAIIGLESPGILGV